MLKCRICNCNCDPGDLVNGVCDDCREEEQSKAEIEKQMERFEKAEFTQLRIDGI